MSTFDKAQIEHIAKLARIRLADGEAEHFASEVTNIMEWIEQLQEVNTEGVPAMAGVGNFSMRVREDVVNDGDVQTDVLLNAPDNQFGCFVVPKVVE